ncbi:class I SAM-dependent methyltransferase [Helicobacter sp. WB40]|nr:class I SAM-dependent methyltransferase [Helicobacter sp. WB40]MDA3967416.1 class I SAM-dependent methyltransferase [Helicobacter sp. WB40]
MDKVTKGKYFNRIVKEYDEGQVAQMGYMSSYAYFKQPIRLALAVARYKFVSKMFSGYDKVLELGCADVFYFAIVADTVGHLVASDYDPVFIDQAKQLNRPENMTLTALDLSQMQDEFGAFDGIYALDVLEHIPKESEDMFMRNILSSLKPLDSAGGGG